MGLTIVDAGVLIGVLDAADVHHSTARKALRAARSRGDRQGVPASAYAEALVSPAAAGPEAMRTVDEFLERLAASIEPIDASIGRQAARLRARHRALRLPDALVIATAAVLEADVLITTDHRWPTRAAPGLRGRLEKLRPGAATTART